MPLPKSMKFLMAALLLTGAAIYLAAQSSTEPAKVLKRTPITYSSPDSGAKMYRDYCAACHGQEGKGDGPAVEFLKGAPPDLRTLAQRNEGKFPAHHVVATLTFGTDKHPHGTSDMPLWGALFRAKDSDRNIPKLRVHNLTAYIESLQLK